MALKEENLIGWLCFIRLAVSNGKQAITPRCVQGELIARGWVEIPDFDSAPPGNARIPARKARITDLGCVVSDLNSPEWGIDPIGPSE